MLRVDPADAGAADLAAMGKHGLTENERSRFPDLFDLAQGLDQLLVIADGAAVFHDHDVGGVAENLFLELFLETAHDRYDDNQSGNPQRDAEDRDQPKSGR